MHLPPVTSSPAPLAAPYVGEPGVPVGVMLLGVRVTAYAIINIAEHQRRKTAGMGAVINPALLDRLMDLPIGISVTDPARDAYRKAAAAYLRELLLRPGRYRRRWEQYAERSRPGRCSRTTAGS